MASTAVAAIQRAVQPVLATRPEMQAAYVFGSAATGRMRTDSDVDIAVLLDGVPPSHTLHYRLTLMADIGAALHRNDVEVVVLNEAPPLLAHRVLSRGRLIFERSASARIAFQVKTAARYLDLVPMFDTHIRYAKKRARGRRAVG
jgi:hypothetical protein